MKFNQKGAAPILILIAIIGVVAFLTVASSAPLKNNLLSYLYPKQESQAAGTTSFLETFDESPKNPDGTFALTPPASWTQSNWAKRFDVFPLDTDSYTREAQWDQLDPIPLTHHGPNCEAPLNVHTSDSIYNAVFNCRNHIMTAILSGYAAVFLTPNALADFSNGESVISWDVSTFQSTGRDWWSLTISPWEDHLAQPLNICCNGEPSRAILLTLDGENFRTNIIENHQEVNRMWGGSIGDSMAQYFPVKSTDPQAAAANRQTYELRVSKTHIKFSMPKLGLVFVDKDINPLNWDKGVVTWTHHAYNPQKGCTPDGTVTGCAPGTWHWDNFAINPAQPFTMIKGDQLGLTKYSASNVVNFTNAAPANSYLRFSGIGTFQVSFDNGANFQTPQKHLGSQDAPEHFSTYFTPVPQGTAKVIIKGSGGINGRWLARNPQIWSQVSLDPNATPLPTPTPTPTPSPFPSGPTTINFDNMPSTALIGQNPWGLVDWGDSKWIVSDPWKKLTTKSFSFNGNGITSGTFTLVKPRILNSLTAYNGGTVVSTITLKCAGNPDKTQVVAVDEITTITTGWTTSCQLITLSSANGWNTNFDNLNLGAASEIVPTAAPSVTPSSPLPSPSSSPSPSPKKIGDISSLNGTPDGIVDMWDYNQLLTDMINDASNPNAKGNVDGIVNSQGIAVDIFDYNLLLGNFGK